MAVGDCGDRDAAVKGPLQVGCVATGGREQPDRSSPHHPAAALAVIVRRLAQRRHLHQRAEAGVAGRAAVVKLGVTDEPPRVVLAEDQVVLVAHPLGAEPAQVRVCGDAGDERDALEGEPHVTA